MNMNYQFWLKINDNSIRVAFGKIGDKVAISSYSFEQL